MSAVIDESYYSVWKSETFQRTEMKCSRFLHALELFLLAHTLTHVTKCDEESSNCFDSVSYDRTRLPSARSPDRLRLL